MLSAGACLGRQDHRCLCAVRPCSHPVEDPHSEVVGGHFKRRRVVLGDVQDSRAWVFRPVVDLGVGVSVLLHVNLVAEHRSASVRRWRLPFDDNLVEVLDQNGWCGWCKRKIRAHHGHAHRVARSSCSGRVLQRHFHKLSRCGPTRYRICKACGCRLRCL